MAATTELDGPALAPASGADPDALVVLLHGLGADGNDLIGLAPEWAALLPNAAFVSPHAPFPCDMAPFGRQWFSLQERTASAILAGIQIAQPILDAFLDRQLAKFGLPDSRLALVGFSQGSMMSLHVAPRRAEPIAGVAAFSGRLIMPEKLEAEAVSKPPVLLVHGDMDDVVPPESLDDARAALGGAGFSVRWHVSRGIGHGIAPDGLQVAAQFLVDVLGRGEQPG